MGKFYCIHCRIQVSHFWHKHRLNWIIFDKTIPQPAQYLWIFINCNYSDSSKYSIITPKWEMVWAERWFYNNLKITEFNTKSNIQQIIFLYRIYTRNPKFIFKFKLIFSFERRIFFFFHFSYFWCVSVCVYLII